MLPPLKRLAELGHQLAEQQDPEHSLRQCVEKVCEWLPARGAAIYLRVEDQRYVLAASTNSSFPKTLRQTSGLGFEHIYSISQSEPAIGILVVARDVIETSQDLVLRKFVADIVPAARSAALVHQLRESRHRMVLMREEERRRLRRNLHNSIGPTLAALNLHVRSVETLLRTNPLEAQSELMLIRRMTSTVITDIRRVIYGLRPPALDELGLIEAIRTQAMVFRSDFLHIDLDLPESFPPIPAAAEVAAYRIVQEALSNITTHANAKSCTVGIQLANDTLHIHIDDDGTGAVPPIRAGVGIMSMRELASELGGMCEIRKSELGGLRIAAWLPCSVSSDNDESESTR